MGPPNESLSRFSSTQNAARDHEFEWLLCLACALKSCQLQPPITFEAAEKHLQLGEADAAAGPALPLSAWQAALKKIQRWRSSGSNHAA